MLNRGEVHAQRAREVRVGMGRGSIGPEDFEVDTPEAQAAADFEDRMRGAMARAIAKIRGGR